MNKKIIVSVISDIVTDQRVQKECNTFHKLGYDVLLIGRKSKRAFQLNELPYKVIRFSNLFRRGPLMYIVFNFQLFFYLLFKNANVFWSNDLDTLLPNFIVAKLKNKKLVYDSHEYFTSSVYKKSSRKIWEQLEKFLFPLLKNVITVNNAIKNIYENKYGIPLTAIRNVPYKEIKKELVENVMLPPGEKILVMQGMGLNENRGAEEAVLMMQYLPPVYNLYFIGSGTILGRLKQMVQELKLSEKVTFVDPLPHNRMMVYTRQCFLGLIFEKIQAADEHLFALPNKFFDYIHAGIPVLSSRAVEIELLIEKYRLGSFIEDFEPESIAKKILEISDNIDQYNEWKYNTIAASNDLNWENEEKILVNFMEHLS